MRAPASPSRPVLAGRIAVPLAPADAPHDPALSGILERVAEGDPEATRALAERLAPRVRRVAHALMGSSTDAEDAAQHALIELLRAHPRVPVAQGIERWTDRAAALAVLRYARALRRRGVAPEEESATVDDERAGRSFERALSRLSEHSREVLLLRHALAFALSELPDALCCSMRTAKDRLLAARRELRAQLRRRGAPREPRAGVLRWAALRDREAVEGPLDDREQEEAEALEEREPEVWAYVAQLRALELYFASHGQPLHDDDRALIEAALPSVQVTSKAVLARALEGGEELDRALDPEESGWPRGIAVGGSALLLLGCAIALLLRAPGGGTPNAAVAAVAPMPRAETPSVESAVAPALAPTVEPLTSVRVARRGGRVRGDGRLLGPGTPLAQGQRVEALDRPACVELAQAGELCLAPGAALRVTSLIATAPRLTLLRGRAVARVREPLRAPVFALELATLRVGLGAGVTGLERGAGEGSARVRAVRGPFEVTGARAHTLNEGQELVLGDDGAHAIAPLGAALAQRDLDLLQASGAPLRSGSPAGAVRLAPDASASGSTDAAGATPAERPRHEAPRAQPAPVAPREAGPARTN